MTAPSPRDRPWRCRRVAAGALVAAFAAALVLVAAPAVAQPTVSLRAPIEGERVAGAVQVVARAVAGPDEEVDAVTLRIVDAGELLGTLRLTRSSGDAAAESTWIGGLDPLTADEGGALPNGPLSLEVRAVASTGGAPQEPTPWSGHVAVFSVAPPTVATTVDIERDTPAAMVVHITWTAVALPDFLRYEVQREDDGAWSTIARLPSADVAEFRDAPASGSQPRYRIRVVRSDGAEGEVSSTGEPVTAGDEPQAPEASEEPSSEPSSEPTAQPSPTTGTSTGPVTGGITFLPPPPPPPAAPVPAPPLSAPPPIAPAAPTFEPFLPFDEEEAEVVERDEEDLDTTLGSVRRGGTLAVYTEEADDRRLYLAGAAGLLLLVLAGHVGRLARGV